MLSTKPLAPAAHFKHLLHLLNLERDYEIAQTKTNIGHLSPSSLEKRGLCLLNLRVTGTRVGLGGKVLVDFERNFGELLPANQFRVGDVVGIVKGSGKEKSQKGKGKGYDEGEEKNVVGVVTRVEEGRITVALKSEVELDGPSWRINKLANDITYSRMEEAVKSVQAEATTSLSPLVEVLLNRRSPTLSQQDIRNMRFYNDELNDAQKEAVRFALSADQVALIHGPPGTGKTQTVVELVRQLVHQGKRLLVCGPSNISVDNLVERLPGTKIKYVRIGHPARVLPSVLEATLDYQLKNSDAAGLISDIRREMDANLEKIAKVKSRSERRLLWQQNRDLRKDLKRREKAAVKGLIDNANVVLSTLNGAGAKNVRFANPFDVLIIDEAAQALEPECWIALRLAPKAIFAGDHHQLPATVKSQEAAALERTLFKRLLDFHGDAIRRLLNVQYRMHDYINDWASRAMYENKVLSHQNVKSRLLSALPDVKNTDETSAPVVLIDTAGCDMWESVAEDGDTKLNEGEAKVVVAHLRNLIAAGVPAKDIGIITPYTGQVDLIKGMMKDRFVVEIGSVDGFQGREKEAVILSLVRSNDKGEVGFLTDNRRLNVAITRAKRHVCLVCDSETIERGSSFLKGIVEYFFEHGEVLSANGIEGMS